MTDATPEINPYQTPQSMLSSGESQSPQGYHIDIHRGTLHCRTGAVLPEICIKSGLPIPASPEPRTRIKRKIYYCPRWTYIGFLVNILLFAVLYFIFRKPCDVTYSIALPERRKLARRKIFGYLGFFGAIALVATGAAMSEESYGWAILIAGAVLIIWSLVLLFRSNGLVAAAYKTEEFTLRGIPKNVLGQFAPGTN